VADTHNGRSSVQLAEASARGGQTALDLRVVLLALRPMGAGRGGRPRPHSGERVHRRGARLVLEVVAARRGELVLGVLGGESLAVGGSLDWTKRKREEGIMR
jgi:hypothetical protein